MKLTKAQTLLLADVAYEINGFYAAETYRPAIALIKLGIIQRIKGKLFLTEKGKEFVK